MLYKTLLIDDEPIAVNRIKRLLKSYPDTFDVIGEAFNGQEGLESIELLRPDLVFLDIEMPILSGFEMLAQLSYTPIVVFVTAYDQFAIKAFEENSIDYLLKPIEKARLDKTVQKLQKLTETQSAKLSIANLQNITELLKPKKEIHSISVKQGDKILIIPLQEIGFFQADEKYVFLHTLDNQQYITTYTISYLAEKLPSNFIRISRSCLVNGTRIKSLEKHFSGKFLVLMQDEKRSKLETGIAFHDNLRRLTEI